MLSYPGGGISHPWPGGTASWVPPILIWPGGTPSWMGRGTPSTCPDLARSGIPPIQVWYPFQVPLPWKVNWDQSLGYLPGRDLGPITGVPLERKWKWKYYGMEIGYHTQGVNWKTNWNYYLPHPSDAGGKNWLCFAFTHSRDKTNIYLIKDFYSRKKTWPPAVGFKLMNTESIV